jgi:hypothetical protein
MPSTTTSPILQKFSFPNAFLATYQTTQNTGLI